MYQHPGIQTFNSTLRKLLTADGDFSWSLHRSTIAIVSVAGNLVHVSGNIVDDSDHVSSCLLAHQSSWYVQWDCRHWRSHGNAQDGHAAAFHYQIDGVDCGRLKHLYFSLILKTGDFISDVRSRNISKLQWVNKKEQKPINDIKQDLKIDHTTQRIGMQLSTHWYGHVLNIYDNIILFKVAKFEKE